VLGGMIRETEIPAQTVAVDFYGTIDIEASPLHALVEEFALQDIVSFRGTVGRREYLRLLQDADVLILIQGDETPWAIPAKAFEYLATGNDILLLAGAHAVAELLADHANVHRSAIDDAATIRACISAIVRRARSGERRRGTQGPALAQLHKRELTRQFAGLLDRTVSPP
jgi:glycosyltransferase involved in cell wall biosynthesis